MGKTSRIKRIYQDTKGIKKMMGVRNEDTNK
jgi:hypothetical protein